MARNSHASIEQLSEATRVEPEVIRRMILSGRLVGFDSLAISALSCQRCGAAITQGRFCNPCQRDLRVGFSSRR